MASFYGGYGEVPPQPSGWQRPDGLHQQRQGGRPGTALAQFHALAERLRAEACLGNDHRKAKRSVDINEGLDFINRLIDYQPSG
jgi:hypothetical protein